jgi:hypothetical protein
MPDKPEAPDMSALVSAYAAPTADFDEQAASDVAALLESRVASLVDIDELGAWMEDTLASLGDDAMAAPRLAAAPGASIGMRRQAVTLSGDGFARIERICSGFGAMAPIDRDANGTFDLTAGFSDSGLDPVVWGRAVDCHQEADGAEMLADGAVSLYVGTNLQVGELDATPILFQLTVFSLIVDGEEILAAEGFDFQVCRGETGACVPGHFELLLDLGTDRTLVFYIDSARVSGGFRAANGLWDCDFAGLTCSDGKGQTVTIPAYQL